eukprot:1127407-Pyramimonas_sp.AAC.1
MFREGLITVGTIVGYDDWWVMPCASLRRRRGPGGTYVSPTSKSVLADVRPDSMDIWVHGGEAQAHLEMAEKYKVRKHETFSTETNWKT